MSRKVLIYSRFPKALMRRIGERFELLDGAGNPLKQVFTTHDLAEVRALITAGATPLQAETMDRMPNLGAIVCYGTGYDGVDLVAASRRKIALGHSPGANASAVADLALTLMLAATRRLLAADAYVRSGSWAAAKPSPLMRPQSGMPARRVGIYGMGAIGCKIASRVAAFESEVAYFSRNRRDVPFTYFASLDALADWCNVLIIAVRASRDNRHAVNADILRRLGEDGYVINIARGSVVDQDALVKALADNVIGGAGLDVYAAEPHIPDALASMPNVVLTPHIGGHTIESHVSMQDCVIANLEAFFAGRPMPYQVDLPRKLV